MTLKLKNLSKWQELPADMSLMLRGNGDAARRITVNLNTDAPMRFVAIEHGVEYFLGVIDGLDAIEFSAEGLVELSAEGDGAVWYWSDDGDVHSHEHPDDMRLFVKPMTREQRSPEMEIMAQKMKAREDRRFAMFEAANERLFNQLAAEREARVALETKLPVGDAAAPGEPDAGAAGAPDATVPASAGDGSAKA